MRIVHLVYDDGKGGATTATRRLHRGLVGEGVDSLCLVMRKYSDEARVIPVGRGRLKGLAWAMIRNFDKLPLRLVGSRPEMSWSLNWIPTPSVVRRVQGLSPDIVHLHWVGNGYVNPACLPVLSRRYPLVWTCDDMWPITGGCHYSGSCTRYRNGCGACPQLNSRRDADISRWVIERKQRAFRAATPIFVTPGRWMGDCVDSAVLHGAGPARVIPYGLDPVEFYPADKDLSRKALGIPRDARVVLFGAIRAVEDTRKGFDLLRETLGVLSAAGEGLTVCIFGSDSGPALPAGLGVRYLGHLNDSSSLALAYSAADVMVVPSRQETFGQTASESLACGTPVVAFNCTGLSDIVTHKKDGYLARPYDVADLAAGIRWVFSVKDAGMSFMEAARRKVMDRYTSRDQAREHLRLYEDVLTFHQGRKSSG